MTTQAPKVLLVELVERTSAAGNRYATGWLGKARLIGFWGGGEDRDGNPTTVLRLYIQEPGERPQQALGQRAAQHRPAGIDRQARAELAAQARHEHAMEHLNDVIPD